MGKLSRACSSVGSRAMLQARFRVFRNRVRFDSFSSVQFGSVRFSSVQFGSVRFSSVQFGSVRFCSVLFGSVRRTAFNQAVRCKESDDCSSVMSVKK